MELANNYIKNLRPYHAVSHKAWNLTDRNNVLKLDWNEATMPPSPKVKEAVEKFLNSGQLNWYPNINNEKLIHLLAKYSQVQTENVQYFAGSDDLHEYIIGTFTEPGNNALIVSPTYDNFRVATESRGVSVSYHKLEEPFDFRTEEFFSHAKKLNPKIVYICNPNNPTGTLYKTSEIEMLAKCFPSTLFIIDEAYYEFTKKSAKNVAVKYRNTIVTRTFSKAFALAGFRIGYAISSAGNIRHLNKIRNPKNVTALSQIAAIAALEDVSYTEAYVKEVIRTKRWFCKQLAKMEESRFRIISNGGNFILLWMEDDVKSSLIRYLQESDIFVRDYGHVEDMDGYLRITVGTKEQMSNFLEKLIRFDHEK